LLAQDLPDSQQKPTLVLINIKVFVLGNALKNGEIHQLNLYVMMVKAFTAP
jgi:hypothetical protein